jgi:hypothetical protein
MTWRARVFWEVKKDAKEESLCSSVLVIGIDIEVEDKIVDVYVDLAIESSLGVQTQTKLDSKASLTNGSWHVRSCQHYIYWGTLHFPHAFPIRYLGAFICTRTVFSTLIRLSLTRNSYGNLNPKWVARGPNSTSNRVPIRETYFGLPERHNLNMDILSPGNSFAERILFWVLLLEKMPNRY